MSKIKYSYLRGRIISLFGTYSNFANKLGKSTTYVSYKLNGKREFTKLDIEEWASLLDIELKEYGTYFFEL